MTQAAVWAAQELLNAVPIEVCDVPAGHVRLAILKLSMEHELSYYDSSYLELALRLKIPLRSNDKRLRDAIMAEKGRGAAFLDG